MILCYTPEKTPESLGFLLFSGVIKWEHSPEIGSQCFLYVILFGVDNIQKNNETPQRIKTMPNISNVNLVNAPN